MVRGYGEQLIRNRENYSEAMRDFYSRYSAS